MELALLKREARPVGLPKDVIAVGNDVVPRRPRYRSLDLWRGVACLLVVFHHCSDHYFSRHWERENSKADHVVGVVLDAFHCGVPLFFVISGYCIAAAADAERRQRDGLRQFFWRRFRRIYPPYWIFVAITILLAVLLVRLGEGGLLTEKYNPLALSGWQWFGTITLTETWWHYVVGAEYWRLAWGHAWTLCYEEQFYLVCGLLLLAPRRFFLLTACVTLIVAVISLFTFKKIGFETSGFFFDGYWLLFATGLLLYYQNNYASRVRSRWITVLFAVGVCGTVLFRFVVCPRLILYDKEMLLASDFVYGACFALLLSLLRGWDDALNDSRWTKPLTACGKMCYSLYLVHFPITLVLGSWLTGFGWVGLGPLLLLVIPLCLALSLAAGWSFHQTVERAFLNTPRRLRPNEDACLAVPHTTTV